MITCLAIGDPHFKVSNVKRTALMTKACLKVANEKKPDFIVLLGDILDRHESIHVTPLTQAVQFIRDLSEISPTYVLIGNHDRPNNSDFLSELHPFSAIKHWKSEVTIVDTTLITEIKGLKFVFVPYVPTGRFMEALQKITEWSQATAIFAHQEFFGVQMGPIKSQEGDKWELTNPLVITGHIHDYHELQTNIIYTGTPIQHAFGDREDKTISWFKFTKANDSILDMLSNCKKSIIYEQERIDLEVAKISIVQLKTEDVPTYVPPSNKIIKIVISGTSADIKTVIKHPNITLWRKSGIKIVYKDIPLLKNHRDEIPLNNINTTFSKLLYHAVCKDIHLEKIYQELFKID